jgi:NAD-dependent deacetylase
VCGVSAPWKEDLSIEMLCASCGQAAMRPDVVVRRDAARDGEALSRCDLFISIGTSGTV